MPWGSSDTVSVIAIGVSLIAAGTSIYQAALARRKQLAEREAQEPVADATVHLTSDLPRRGELHIDIRNQSPYRLRLREIRVLKPTGVSIGKISNKPPETIHRSMIEMNNILEPFGTVYEFTNYETVHDDWQSLILSVEMPPQLVGKKYNLRILLTFDRFDRADLPFKTISVARVG